MGAIAQTPPPAPEYAPEGADPVQTDADEYADTDPSALTDFRSTLDPHGSWIDDPTYGQLWVPNADEVGPSFSPYVTDGSWAYEEDFVWISSFSWGWVPFHYGRWAWTSGRWGWIPGRVYAGAWVSWRVGADGYGYVGWGPLAPNFGWRSGAAYPLAAEVTQRATPIVFVARDGLFGAQLTSRILVGEELASVAPNTHPYVRSDVRASSPAAVRGPNPATLGIRTVMRVSPSDASVGRARAFARPSTARAVGGSGPSRKGQSPPPGAAPKPQAHPEAREAPPRVGPSAAPHRR